MDRHHLLHRALRLSVLSIVLAGLLGGTAVVVGLSDRQPVAARLRSRRGDRLGSLGRPRLAIPDRGARAASGGAHRTARRRRGRYSCCWSSRSYLAVSAVNALMANAHPESSPARTALLLAAVIVLPPLALAKYRVARALGQRRPPSGQHPHRHRGPARGDRPGFPARRRAVPRPLGRCGGRPHHRRDHRSRGLVLAPGDPNGRPDPATPEIGSSPRARRCHTIRRTPSPDPAGVESTPGGKPCRDRPGRGCSSRA